MNIEQKIAAVFARYPQLVGKVFTNNELVKIAQAGDYSIGDSASGYPRYMSDTTEITGYLGYPIVFHHLGGTRGNARYEVLPAPYQTRGQLLGIERTARASGSRSLSQDATNVIALIQGEMTKANGKANGKATA